MRTFKHKKTSNGRVTHDSTCLKECSFVIAVVRSVKLCRFCLAWDRNPPHTWDWNTPPSPRSMPDMIFTRVKESPSRLFIYIHMLYLNINTSILKYTNITDIMRYFILQTKQCVYMENKQNHHFPPNMMIYHLTYTLGTTMN